MNSLIVQFSFFPGDPGEDDEEFDFNWTAEAEPVRSFNIDVCIGFL